MHILIPVKLVKSRLEIDGESVGFITELPISQNLSVADVREPGKGASTFTKTIVIPGEPVIKRLFENCFQVNSTLSNFNPNLKTPARYYVNEVLVFDGNLQLLRINNKYVNDLASTEFECSLVGENKNLFTDIAGLYLTDIDFSDLDHVFNYASGLFNPAELGTGYVYGYQDYGLNPTGAPLTDTWYFRYLKPLFFEREIVTRIFEDAGYSWASGGYFDSTYAKSIVIPDNSQGALKLPQADKELNWCYVGRSGTYTNSVEAGTLVGSAYKFYNNNEDILAPVRYNDETAPFFDTGNIFDSVTNFRMQVNQGGTYYIYGSITFGLNVVSHPTNAVTYESNGTFGFNTHVETSPDGSTWTQVGGHPTYTNFGPIQTIDEYEFKVSVNIPNLNLTSGEYVRITVQQNQFNEIVFRDAGSVIVTAPSASMRFDMLEESVFEAKLAFPDLEEGGTVRMDEVIPKDITQLDFLTSIIRMEHLYFEPSKTVKDQYTVETREDFIDVTAANAYDWTDKWDISRGEEIIPMGELDWNRLTFTYKSDKDYYNKKYEDKYKEVYGTESVDIDNDFIKKEKKIEVIFSATPTVGNYTNDIVCPAYYEKDQTTNVVRPLKVNIRRLYWGGLIDCQPHVLVYGGVDNTMTQYPFVGHVDNPLTPTVDLCFDNPLELYWDFPGNTYTDNNRYNNGYSKYIGEITDQNSKIVRRWFNLNESDIAGFSFRRLVFVRDAYYFVNKIMDYNPQVKGVTQVELLKLKAGSVFVPSTLNIDDLGGDDDPISSERTGNTNNGTGVISGINNYNNGIGVVISGNNNLVE